MFVKIIFSNLDTAFSLLPSANNQQSTSYSTAMATNESQLFPGHSTCISGDTTTSCSSPSRRESTSDHFIESTWLIFSFVLSRYIWQLFSDVHGCVRELQKSLSIYWCSTSIRYGFKLFLFTTLFIRFWTWCRPHYERQ